MLELTEEQLNHLITQLPVTVKAKMFRDLAIDKGHG
jgi:hypothetical protein